MLRTIGRIGIFMICAQTIVHFRPRETYEKYLKLLVGVMVLIQLFLPLGSFLLGGGLEQALEKLETFRGQMEQEMEAAAREAAETDALLERMTLEEIRREMEERSAETAEEEEIMEIGDEDRENAVTVGPIEIHQR